MAAVHRRHRRPGFRPEKLAEFLEAAYDFESEDLAWLAGMMSAARAVWGRGGPMHGGIYDASDVSAFRLLDVHADGFEGISVDPIHVGARTPQTPAFVARTYRSLLVNDASVALPEMRGMHDGMAAQGFVDTLYVNGLDPGGRGALFGLWRRDSSPLPAAEMAIYRRMAHHMGAASRCRQRLRQAQAGRPAIDATDGAEAILDARRRVVHAAGPATTKSARLALVAMSRARDRARVPRAAAVEELARWCPLTKVRWTLVDSFERSGSRYIVARANQAEVSGLAMLSDRERQVVAYAALGQSAKETAYALGLSGSTVRVLLARAAAKLGTRGAALFDHPEVRKLKPGGAG